MSFERWAKIKFFEGDFPEPESTPKPLKNREIPVLECYKNDPGPEFWTHFPYNPLPHPEKPNTPLNGVEFGNLYIPLMDEFTPDGQIQMIKCQADILYGVDSLFDFEKVQPLFDVNSRSLYPKKVGSFFTGQLVSLI